MTDTLAYCPLERYRTTASEIPSLGIGIWTCSSSTLRSESEINVVFNCEFKPVLGISSMRTRTLPVAPINLELAFNPKRFTEVPSRKSFPYLPIKTVAFAEVLSKLAITSTRSDRLVDFTILPANFP